MKKQSYKLNIENPCGQDWDLMTQNHIGKYCSHCSKTVIDFTSLSDKEVLDIISQTSDKVCGRLTKEQIDRPFLYKQPMAFSKFYNLLTGIILLFTSEKAFANERNPIYKIINQRKFIQLEEVKEEDFTRDTLKNIVQGKVIDRDTKEVIPLAKVSIKGTDISINADIEGKFKLHIPDLMTENIIIISSSIGYKSTETFINSANIAITNELLLLPIQPDYMGEVCIVTKKRKWWKFWK